jgi:HK97 gp10 family phage protein
MASFRRAAKPLVQAAKADAPYKTGQLSRSIGTIEYPENVSIMVGAKLTGGPRKSGWYGNILEVGSYKVGERFRKKMKGKRIAQGKGSTGKLSGTHFFENAYNTSEAEMNNQMSAEWYAELDRMIIRVNNKLK